MVLTKLHLQRLLENNSYRGVSKGYKTIYSFIPSKLPKLNLTTDAEYTVANLGIVNVNRTVWL